MFDLGYFIFPVVVNLYEKVVIYTLNDHGFKGSVVNAECRVFSIRMKPEKIIEDNSFMPDLKTKLFKEEDKK